MHTSLKSLVASGLLLACSIAMAQTSADWSRFRGPNGTGVSTATGVPTKWSESENIAWKTALPGAGASSPIIWQDHIYLTAYSGFFVPGQEGGSQQDLQRHLICLDRTTGKLLWERKVKAVLPEEERIRDHGFAASTPVADANGVIVFFGKTGVIAFDHAGKQQWQANVGSKTHGWGSAASPILYGDDVLVNASVESESLVALSRKDGREKWRLGGIREAWNTPAVVANGKGSDELVLARHGHVLGVNPKTGKELWTCETDIGWYMVPSAVSAKDVVYFLGGRSGTAALAVRTGGSGDVTASHRLWTSVKGSNVTSPVIHDGHLYWMHEKLGIAYCADAATGELNYEVRVGGGNEIYGSALLAGGNVYYLDRSGRTFVVAAKSEYEPIATNDLRDRSQFNSSPVAMGHQLLIRSDRYLYCIGAGK